jgi:hypothetical protein
MLVISERGMYYEEKGIDGWLWWRRTPDGPWEKASDQQMTARMRKALAMVVEAADYPEHKRQEKGS